MDKSGGGEVGGMPTRTSGDGPIQPNPGSSPGSPSSSAASTPLVVVEALRLADRIEKGYPEVWLREESQDALVQLARFVREELKLDA